MVWQCPSWTAHCHSLPLQTPHNILSFSKGIGCCMLSPKVGKLGGGGRQGESWWEDSSLADSSVAWVEAAGRSSTCARREQGGIEPPCKKARLHLLLVRVAGEEHCFAALGPGGGSWGMAWASRHTIQSKAGGAALCCFEAWGRGRKLQGGGHDQASTSGGHLIPSKVGSLMKI